MNLFFIKHAVEHYNYGLISALKRYIDRIYISQDHIDVLFHNKFLGTFLQCSLVKPFLKILAKTFSSIIIHANYAFVAYQIVNFSLSEILVLTKHGVPMPELVLEKDKKLFYFLEGVYLQKLQDEGIPIITISDYCAKMLFKRWGVKVMDYIYHGVLRNLFNKHVKKSFNLKEPTILYVSRMVPCKEPMIFWRAIELLVRDGFKFKVIYLDVGALRKKIVKFLKKKDLMSIARPFPYVHFTKMPQIYACGDILVHSGRYEGFGLSVLEAMSCGLPVVVPNEGGAYEIARECGVIFEAGNYEDLAVKLANLLENKDYLYRLRELSLSTAKHFTWERAALRYLKIYKKILT